MSDNNEKYFLYNNKKYENIKEIEDDNGSITAANPIIYIRKGDTPITRLHFYDSNTNDMKCFEFSIAVDMDFWLGAYDCECAETFYQDIYKQSNEHLYDALCEFIIDTRMNLELKNAGFKEIRQDIKRNNVGMYNLTEYRRIEIPLINKWGGVTDDFLQEYNEVIIGTYSKKEIEKLLEEAKIKGISNMEYSMQLQMEDEKNSISITHDDLAKSEASIFRFIADGEKVRLMCEGKDYENSARIRCQNVGHNEKVGLFEGYKLIRELEKEPSAYKEEKFEQQWMFDMLFDMEA